MKLSGKIIVLVLLFFMNKIPLFNKLLMNSLPFSSAKTRQWLPLKVDTVFQIGFGLHFVNENSAKQIAVSSGWKMSVFKN